MITKINLVEHNCSSYLKWKKYIRIFHENLLQKKIYCDETNPKAIFINSSIQDDIIDPDTIAVAIPNS